MRPARFPSFQPIRLTGAKFGTHLDGVAPAATTLQRSQTARDSVHFSGRSSSQPDSFYGHLRYPVAEPDDLEPIYNDSRYLLHKKAARAFREMAEAAAKDGITIAPVSAFRTLERQHELFYGEAERRGITVEERAKLCAPPGYSEHHTGYTLDIRDNTPGTLLEEKFADTRAFQWMQNNAHRFGFVLSFPKDNQQGVMYEPWHWRWEGDETSRKLFAKAREVNGQN